MGLDGVRGIPSGTCSWKLHMVLGIYGLGVAQVPPLNTPHPWKHACSNVRSVTPKRITEAVATRPGGGGGGMIGTIFFLLIRKTFFF